MERYTMFLEWKHQYCENDYTTLSNIQIQCNPCQITVDIFSQNYNKKFYSSHRNTKDPNIILQ